MIITVTPNPALDVTYTVGQLIPGRTHRVKTALQRPGGKGLNVARVLHQLGQPVMAMGMVGGLAGDLVSAELDSLGIDRRLTRIDGQTRRCVTVVDGGSGEATVFNEPGPTVTPSDWTRLLADVRPPLLDAQLLVCSGSFPPGSPVDASAPLIRAATEAGVMTIVDTSGAALLAAVEARPTVVKPNRDELLEVTGLTDPVAAAHALRDRGRTAVVASLGAGGLIAVTDDGTFQVEPSKRLTGNPTGAGDSVVAAVAAGLTNGQTWPDILGHAVTLGAATVLSPVAGEFDLTAFERLRQHVDIKEQ